MFVVVWLSLFLLVAPAPNAGEKAFAADGCSGCHSIGGGRVRGPDLAGVGTRMDRGTLVQFIRDPRVVYARSGAPRNAGYPLMPPLGVQADEARAIADYLIGRSESLKLRAAR